MTAVTEMIMSKSIIENPSYLNSFSLKLEDYKDEELFKRELNFYIRVYPDLESDSPSYPNSFSLKLKENIDKERFKRKLKRLGIKIDEYPEGFFEKFVEDTSIEALNIINQIINELRNKGYDFYIEAYPDPESDTNLLDFVILPQGKSNEWFENTINKLYNLLRQKDPQRYAWFVGFDIKI